MTRLRHGVVVGQSGRRYHFLRLGRLTVWRLQPGETKFGYRRVGLYCWPFLFEVSR